MDTETMVRFGAACGVVVGLATGVPGAVEAFTGETAATSLVLGFGVVAAVPFVVALALRSAFGGGRGGAVTYGLGVIGVGLFAAVAFALNVVLGFLPADAVSTLRDGPTGPALRIAGLVFVVSTVVMAVAMVRARVLPRVPAALFGVLLPTLALTASQPDSVATSALHVAAGSVLVWLSVRLTAAEPTVSAATGSSRAAAASSA